MFKLKDQSDTF